ncbi:MAG: nucleotidyltransferase domain-containing protein [Bacteroidota bacterium]
MRQEILDGMSSIEAENGFSVLFACESGSRAWGFASSDSDYDVRGIFAYPRDNYLSIVPRRDICSRTLPGDLDISCWDIRKALSHFRKSNATLFEWLQSPIFYLDRQNFRDRLWEMRESYFAPRVALHHYLGIAKGVLLRLEGEQIRIKQYFYILRPLLAAEWIAKTQQPPSVEFADLFEQATLSAGIRTIIQELWDQKIQVTEKDSISLIPELQAYIVQAWEALDEASQQYEKRETKVEPLNELFRDMLA